MPYTAAQWKAVFSKLNTDQEKGEKLIEAYQTNRTYPAGLEGNDNYDAPIANAIRTQIVADFYALVDQMILDLQTARNAP